MAHRCCTALSPFMRRAALAASCRPVATRLWRAAGLRGCVADSALRRVPCGRLLERGRGFSVRANSSVAPVVSVETPCIVYTDGACRGNPGPIGAGVVIVDRETSEVVAQSSVFLGTGTNNSAEYWAAVSGLQLATVMGLRDVTLRVDSKLVAKQISGEYKVKAAHLLPFVEVCRSLLDRVPTWSVEHVRRGRNHAADRLANAAIDLYLQGDQHVDGEPKTECGAGSEGSTASKDEASSSSA